MAQLVWDTTGTRFYETGLDRGVLYLPTDDNPELFGYGLVWNGLTSIVEKFNKDSSAVYYDGMKISDLVVLGDFSGTMKAITYPDEFLELEGLASNRLGLFYADQVPQIFGLSYRTRIGNDIVGDDLAYKIHIIYNVSAMSRDKTYSTVSSDPSLVEFEWDISAVPEEIPGFRPTAHIVLDSRTLDPMLLEELEQMLYGNEMMDAALPTMEVLVTYISEWTRLKIIDNGDGTWTAEAKEEEYIEFGLDGYFELNHANVVYLDADTYEISSTTDIAEIL